MPHCAAYIAAKACTRPLSCPGRSRSYAPEHPRTHGIGIRKTPSRWPRSCRRRPAYSRCAGAICAADLAWPGLVSTGRLDATLAGMEKFAVGICVRTLLTTIAEPTHQETRFAVVVSVLRRIHYRDVDNPRCYVSDGSCETSTVREDNVRVEHRVCRTQLSKRGCRRLTSPPTVRTRVVSGGQGHLLARAATIARSSERDEGITLRPQPETLRLCSGQKPTPKLLVKHAPGRGRLFDRHAAELHPG